MQSDIIRLEINVSFSIEACRKEGWKSRFGHLVMAMWRQIL